MLHKENCFIAEIENIFDNTDFIYLLNQNGGDKEELAKRLNFRRG